MLGPQTSPPASFPIVDINETKQAGTPAVPALGPLTI